MREIPFVDLIKQYRSLKPEIDRVLIKNLFTGEFILGKENIRFEAEFASFCGVKFAVGVDSGLSALDLGIRSLDIGKNDEVIVPVNSFIASASAVTFTGAKPVFVDCREDSFNIDLDKAEKLITGKTKALLIVHLCGRLADVDSAKKLAKKYKLFLIEDACQAHGSAIGGKRAGSFGDVAAFSFYPGKNLGAYGDGGMLTTNNPKVRDKVKLMRHYGQRIKNVHTLLGWNKRLDNIQAAILRIKLKRLSKWNRQRILNARLYDKLLKSLPVITPQETQNQESNYHLYIIRVKKRDELAKYLSNKGIQTGIHYPIPIHLQPAYSDLGYNSGDFPVAEKLAKEILSLPMFPELEKNEINYICRQIARFYGP